MPAPAYLHSYAHLNNTRLSKLALGPTHSPIQWVKGALCLGVKRPGRETDHSPPSGTEVKECVELYLHSPDRFYGVVFKLSAGTTSTLLF